MVDNGTFREDLYYRINVIPIKIPPLRERKDDISPLIFSFINNYNKENQTDKKVTNQFIDALIKYDWPAILENLKIFLKELQSYQNIVSLIMKIFQRIFALEIKAQMISEMEIL